MAVLVISVIVALSIATPLALVGAQGPPADVDQDFKLSDLGFVFCDFDVRFQVHGKQGTIELPGEA
jgi:hypothetical protein